ncbi:hypothetical protein [Kitasatospora sp. NPDC096204]|uniref:hypothetical protein n=1 Tax=Kitasatospora sp. NPDC096204 TaxID=3364094 RepID=UPI00382538A8
MSKYGSAETAGQRRDTAANTHHVALHPLIVTAATEHRAAHRVLASPALRVARADEVRPGDLIVSAFEPAAPGRLRLTDYFVRGPYPAAPGPYDPACGCGVCGLPEVEGPHGTVVLARGFPWECCDPWPADEPVLVLPLHRTPRRSPCPST